MQEQIEARLQQLKEEFERGQRLLGELEAQQASVRSTLLRISGAMQVLEELLNGSAPEGDLHAEDTLPESGPRPLPVPNVA
jgi:ABC-type transporter Mla subunit MlaD